MQQAVVVVPLLILVVEAKFDFTILVRVQQSLSLFDLPPP